MKSDGFIAVGILALLLGSLITLNIGWQIDSESGYHIDGVIEKHDYEVFPPRTAISNIAEDHLTVGIQYVKYETIEHWIIYRSYLSFNTSYRPPDIPDGAEITKVMLCIGRHSDDSILMDFNVLVMGGEQPLYGDSLEEADWGCGSVELTTINTANFEPLFKYINLSIPSDQINKQGLTQFELKSDIENVDLSDTSSQRAQVRFWSSDSEESMNAPEPLLTVEYEVPAEEGTEIEKTDYGEEQPQYRPPSDQTLIASAVFLAVGGLSIGYGFMQRKKKE